MNLPMLVVVHGNPHFDTENSIRRWEETVTAMLKEDAPDVITTAKAQLQLMESWLAMRPEEPQFLVSLKLPKCAVEICLQKYPTDKK